MPRRVRDVPRGSCPRRHPRTPGNLAQPVRREKVRIEPFFDERQDRQSWPAGRGAQPGADRSPRSAAGGSSTAGGKASAKELVSLRPCGSRVQSARKRQKSAPEHDLKPRSCPLILWPAGRVRLGVLPSAAAKERRDPDTTRQKGVEPGGVRRKSAIACGRASRRRPRQPARRWQTSES